ncbi:3-isopropylmalate dehydratase large subunit [Candidatus Desantisbacteria bacterium]|nr:3-isopropylmalate dehydratase large subunit [Candidatus Desantisbacteria bacterium]
MGKTIAEKILGAHMGREVSPGELIEVDVDIALGNDITTPLAIVEFERLGIKDVFDRDRVVLVPDHFAPNKDVRAAQQCKMLREFAKKYNITNYFEVGRMGIEHALLPEAGLVLPGDIIIGADSHTCTYGALGSFATGIGSTDLAAVMATGQIWFMVPESIKFVYNGSCQKWVGGKDLILHTIGRIGVDGANYAAMEFCGEVISSLSMSDRVTMSNMAIEAGGKCGIIQADETTIEYVSSRAKRSYKIYQSDSNAEYKEVYEFDCSRIEPQVAFPHLPSNTKPISEVGDIKIDQGIIGSCTNGRIEDLRIAAQVLKGKKVHSEVRLIIIPATQKIYQLAIKEGLIDIFIEAQAVVSTPTCGPCLGGHMGILAEGEKAIATTNRNFVGRMGHPKSEVYLASPAIAAASCIKGRIASPEEVL